VVCLSLPTGVINRQDVPVELVSAHLEGTEGIRFPSALVVPSHTEENAFLGARVRPVIAQAGKLLTGSVVFVDSKGQDHRAGTATFEPPPDGWTTAAAQEEKQCGFCGVSIAPEDFFRLLNGAAHRSCIWR
jgi:hypothetical protein